MVKRGTNEEEDGGGKEKFFEVLLGFENDSNIDSDFWHTCQATALASSAQYPSTPCLSLSS